MELGALEAEALLASAELAEVLRRLRHNVSAELHDDLARTRAADGHIEETFRVGHVWIVCGSCGRRVVGGGLNGRVRSRQAGSHDGGYLV